MTTPLSFPQRPVLRIDVTGEEKAALAKKLIAKGWRGKARDRGEWLYPPGTPGTVLRADLRPRRPGNFVPSVKLDPSQVTDLRRPSSRFVRKELIQKSAP